ncbi:MAG: hypothetical protein JW388_1433 [Nitrospira sp.]|nr:hypothetical protein [Nitrospira sp.]
MRIEQWSDFCQADLHRLPGAVRDETDFERQQLIEQIRGAQHCLDDKYAFFGQVNRQGFLPAIQPESLDQHEQSADVIHVQMCQPHGIDFIGMDVACAQLPRHWLARIHKQNRAAESVKIGRMTALAVGQAVASSQTSQLGQ